jgi:tripartite-type tricarboxylate transporter receptor subunit TctC
MAQFAALLLVAVWATCGVAFAQSGVAEFYRGKTIRVLIGFGPGGSSSFYGEILARYMGRHLPGNPTVITQHMPGAGGLTVANYVNSRSPRDGTEFAITSRNAVFEPLLGNKNAMFEALKFNWIGNANIENSVCISWHTSPIKSVKDLMSGEFIGGGTGSDSLEVSIPKVLNQVLNTKFKIVTGYPSSVDILLAMERGELQGFCGIGWTYVKLRKADWLQDKKINILFQMALARHPDLPDTPLAQDLAANPQDRALIEFLLAPQDMGRPFFAPPDVPAERVAALRQAFAKTLADPDFLRDAEKAGVEVQFASGEAVQALLERIHQSPRALVERAMNVLR